MESDKITIVSEFIMEHADFVKFLQLQQVPQKQQSQGIIDDNKPLDLSNKENAAAQGPSAASNSNGIVAAEGMNNALGTSMEIVSAEPPVAVMRSILNGNETVQHISKISKVRSTLVTKADMDKFMQENNILTKINAQISTEKATATPILEQTPMSFLDPPPLIMINDNPKTHINFNSPQVAAESGVRIKEAESLPSTITTNSLSQQINYTKDIPPPLNKILMEQSALNATNVSKPATSTADNINMNNTLSFSLVRDKENNPIGCTKSSPGNKKRRLMEFAKKSSTRRGVLQNNQNILNLCKASARVLYSNQNAVQHASLAKNMFENHVPITNKFVQSSNTTEVAAPSDVRFSVKPPPPFIFGQNIASISKARAERAGIKVDVESAQPAAPTDETESDQQAYRNHAKSKQFFECVNCGKLYASISGILNHYTKLCPLTDHSERPFFCEKCKTYFRYQQAYACHKCKEPRNICAICGKSFNRPWLLTVHHRRHTGEKPYECEICTVKFADRSNLRTHMNTHLGIKRYGCPVCKKNFTRLQTLDEHLRKGCNKTPQQQPKEPGKDLMIDAMTLLNFSKKVKENKESMRK